MRRRRVLPLLILAASLTEAAFGAPPPRALSGRVLLGAVPLPTVQVYAYQLVDHTLRLATTSGLGEYRFDALPAGLYRIIAFKPGFVPAVVVVSRASLEAAQWVEVELGRAAEDASKSAEDFWSLRAEVPPDVLREITAVGAAGTPSPDAVDPRAFTASIGAETGLAEMENGPEAAVAGGAVSLSGSVRGVELDLDGDFRQLGGQRLAMELAGAPEGQTASVAVRVGSDRQGQLQLRSAVNHLEGPGEGERSLVDLADYGLSWTRAVGRRGESAVRASYVEESGLHSHGALAPAAIPLASRSLRVEGSYSHAFAGESQLRAGVRYREGEELLSTGAAAFGSVEPTRSIEAYGDGDLALTDRFNLQYGLLGGMRDGGVALTPRTGVELRLGEAWSGRLVAVQRFELGTDSAWPEEFVPLALAEGGQCDIAGLSCYQLTLSYGAGDRLATVTASQRELDRTVRLYFSSDFFDRLESLYLVPGDSVPELRFAVSRRLFDSVVARVESTVATGGGGVYLAANRKPYENGVAYLVASVDTRFTRSDTGVMLVFQRLEQDLSPLSGEGGEPGTPLALALESLQLTLTQDLNAFFELGATWAMRLDMQLSRGASFLGARADDGLRRRLTTGVAVRF